MTFWIPAVLGTLVPVGAMSERDPPWLGSEKLGVELEDIV
jgi:hypothetical protein